MKQTEPVTDDCSAELPPEIEIQVHRDGRLIKTISRPIHVTSAGHEVFYKGKRYQVVDGNRIEVGGDALRPTLSSAEEPLVCAATQGDDKPRVDVGVNGGRIRQRSDAPASGDWTGQQRRVIEAPISERLIVEAAPGTGKTAVACARIARFLGDHVPASNLWLISFTRTAIQEVRNRIATLSGEGESAYGVRIATIDSHAWQLRQGFDAKASATFSTFEKGIEDALTMLREGDEELLQELARLDHVIIDEAQDVVGVRRELLESIIGGLRQDAGVTVLCDPAQAIYGFTEDDKAAPGELPLAEVLKGRDDLAFQTCEMTEVIRTPSPGLRHLFVDTRRLVLHAGPDSMKQLLDDLAAHGDGSVGMAIGNNGIAGRDDALVLYRRRSEVLTSAAFLAAARHPFRLRMSGLPVRIAPWVGMVFCDWDRKLMPEQEFMARFTARVPDRWRSPSVDWAWQALVRHAGQSKTSVDLRRLREVLSRKQPPLDFASPEVGDSGPVIGTIHASKGREAEEVHLMLADVQDTDVIDADEMRVVFVGATRARRVLKIGKAGGRYSSCCESGRRYTFKRDRKSAQVELGRDRDVDDLSLVSRALHADVEAAARTQELIASLGGAPRPAMILRAPAGDGEYRWGLFSADRQHVICRISETVNADLWEIARRTPVRGAKPPASLNHVSLLCARTVVRAHGDASLPLMHEPWATSGFWLAPVIFSYSMAYFSNA